VWRRGQKYESTKQGSTTCEIRARFPENGKQLEKQEKEMIKRPPTGEKSTFILSEINNEMLLSGESLK
jgi:hypothetical protein